MAIHTEEHYTFADESNRQAKIQTAVSRVLEASPVKHQGTREQAVIAIIDYIRQNHTFRVSDRGWVHVEASRSHEASTGHSIDRPEYR